MKQHALTGAAVMALAILIVPAAAPQSKPKPPKTPRLYVIDCGLLTMSAPQLFGFTKEEIGEKQPFAVPCYLVVHPKGTLMWDTGVIPDAQVNGAAKGISTVTKTLKSQLAEIGYAPKDITYLGLSHLHSDHTANANDFAGSTWLVHQKERDAMFAPPPPPGGRGGRGGPVQNTFFDKLKDAKTKILPDSDYDVFGDGTVVIKYAPGHTPGHQVLFLRLKESGPILIAGDLYHLPQEITMHRFPTFDFDKDQTAVSREQIEAFIRQTGARLWIEHDLATFTLLKKSPAYYE
ncbi:MAG TPA: N-acyl homoserine lactonase family protein [Bryobacteraceae bacterium]|jgi:glyoxylase-like metal-dependent hydrolase (beta-lactamase superfamily II)|nr:N-acyl homoserine lactonase family protein [Bryobacteraceae bacterium]